MALGNKWETWVKVGKWEQHCAKVTNGHNAKYMEEFLNCSLKKVPDEECSCNEDNVLSLLDQGVSGHMSKAMWKSEQFQHLLFIAGYTQVIISK